MPAKIRTASRLRNRPSLLTAADNCHRRATPSDMLNRAYLDQTLRRPLPLKDGRILRTLADAAQYVVALPEHRRRAHWDRAALLLLNGADASEISRQLELGLFYDRQLDFRAANAQTQRPGKQERPSSIAFPDGEGSQ